MSSTVSTTVPSRSNTTGSNPGCGRGSDTEPLQVELPGGELGEQFGVQQVVAQRRDRHAAAADHVEVGVGPLPGRWMVVGDEVLGRAGEGVGASEYFVPYDHPTAGEWADTDFDVVGRGCVAVTPLRYDLLDPELLAELASWEFDLERLRV